MPKVGDVVLYSAFGRTLNALVIKVGPTQPSHAGKNGEDTLSLLFLDPAREPNPKPKLGPLAERPGYLPQQFVEHDVVHASQEFPEAYKKEKGLRTPAQITAERGHGEWSEASPVPTWQDINWSGWEPRHDPRTLGDMTDSGGPACDLEGCLGHGRALTAADYPPEEAAEIERIIAAVPDFPNSSSVPLGEPNSVSRIVLPADGGDFGRGSAIIPPDVPLPSALQTSENPEPQEPSDVPATD